jgi:hypothetical protein
LFDPWVLIPAILFPVSSRNHEKGFVSATEWFRGLWMMKQLHGFAITAISEFARLKHGAKHNGAKRNMIAWRRCVSTHWTLKTPSKALSAEVVQNAFFCPGFFCRGGVAATPEGAGR